MIKPNIYIIRHAESHANTDPNLYKKVPDHEIPLTAKGREQARCLGKKIIWPAFEPREKTLIYTSPYVRSIETAKLSIISALDKLDGYHGEKYTIYEDPSLREQERNMFDPESYTEKRDFMGSFFFRFPNGESGADVYDRCSAFLETLFRQAEKKKAGNVMVYTHGFTARILAMRLTHATYREFETWENPHNAQAMFCYYNEESERYVIAK